MRKLSVKLPTRMNDKMSKVIENTNTLSLEIKEIETLKSRIDRDLRSLIEKAKNAGKIIKSSDHLKLEPPQRKRDDVVHLAEISYLLDTIENNISDLAVRAILYGYS